jgi:putative addiction module component (TIGR02574 family)
MSVTSQNVLQAALSLPESERVELIDALIGSLPADEAAPLDDAWLAEIDRRSCAYDAGNATPVAWADVKKRARSRMTDRG